MRFKMFPVKFKSKLLNERLCVLYFTKYINTSEATSPKIATNISEIFFNEVKLFKIFSTTV